MTAATGSAADDDENDDRASRKLRTRSVSTQTPVNHLVVQQMIEEYWKWLDARGIDQGKLNTLFIIGTKTGGLRACTADANEK